MKKPPALLAGAFLSLVLPSVLYFGTSDNFLIKYSLLAAVFLAFIICRRINRLSVSNTSVWMFLYFLFAAISLTWSGNRYVSLDVLARAALIAVCGYVIGASVPKKDMRSLAAAVAVGSVVPVVYGFLQALGFDPFQWQNDFSGRISSLLGNPNFFSGYLIAVMPITAYLAYSGAKKASVSYGILLTGQAACLVLTGTRSSIGAMLFQIIIMFILIQKRKIIAGALILLLIAGSLMILRGDAGRRFINGFSLKSSSVRQRYFRWQTAIEMCRERPLFGHGVGGVKSKFSLYQARIRRKHDIKIKGTSESQIHSEYLQVLAETGLIGFFLFAAFIFSGLKGILMHKSTFSSFAFISAAGVLLDSIAAFPLFIVPTGYIFYLLIGMFSDEKSGINIGYGNSIIIKVIAAVIFMRTAAPAFYADVLRNRADRVSHRSAMQAHDYYERAHALYPVDGQAEYRHAKLMMQHKEADLALSALQNSAAIRHYGEVYNNIGLIYYLKNDTERALINWEKALEIGLPDKKAEEALRKNIRILTLERESGR